MAIIVTDANCIPISQPELRAVESEFGQSLSYHVQTPLLQTIGYTFFYMY